VTHPTEPPRFAVVSVHLEQINESGVPTTVAGCYSLEAVVEAIAEQIKPDHWVSVIGLTSAGMMRPLYDSESYKLLGLLAERGYDVDETARTGNTFMVKATLA
jgi:hypothetical protein